jgi:hypothetical protein
MPNNPLNDYAPFLVTIPRVTKGDGLPGVPENDDIEQTVEPDVICIPTGFGVENQKYWMVVTPLPDGNAFYENPCIFASDDGLVWKPPAGLLNPLIGGVGDPASTYGENNDPCILVSDGELWVYYLASVMSEPDDRNSFKTTLFRLRSFDGVQWNGPETQFYEPTDARLMSPSVYWDGHRFVLYYVNWDRTAYSDGGDQNIYRRESSDGSSWGDPTQIHLTGVPSGWHPWHLNVIRDPDNAKLHMLLVISTTRGHDGDLYYAHSDNDGASFAVRPLFTHERYPFEQGFRYRGGIVQHSESPKHFLIWYSAANGDPIKWQTVYVPAVLSGDVLNTQIGYTRIWVVQYDKLIRIDTITGFRQTQIGDYSGTPAMAALDAYLYIVQNDALGKVDPSTGDWNRLIGEYSGTTAMAALDGNLYIVQREKLGRVDTAGNWTTLNGEYSGTTAMAALNGYLYIVQRDKLGKVDKDGNWNTLNGEWSGTTAMTVQGNRLFIVQLNELVQVDPDTGDWTRLAGEWTGTTAMVALGDWLYIVQYNELLRVDPETGNWTRLAGEWTGTTAMAAFKW